MTIADFKAWVIGYANRDAARFTVGTIDYVLQAMNAARRMAQREYAFELLRDEVFLATSVAGANWMTGCKTTPGGSTGVSMRRLDSVWTFNTSAVGATPVYIRNAMVDLDRSSSFKRDLPLQQYISDTTVYSSSRQFAYLKGAMLIVYPQTTVTNYMLCGIKWLDDLTGSESPDIFLTLFTDWLFTATLLQLNQYLKDDQRFQIDAVSHERAWNSVKQLDGELANSGGISLD